MTFFDSLEIRSPDGIYWYVQKTGKGIVFNSSMQQDMNNVLSG